MGILGLITFLIYIFETLAIKPELKKNTTRELCLEYNTLIFSILLYSLD